MLPEQTNPYVFMGVRIAALQRRAAALGFMS